MPDRTCVGATQYYGVSNHGLEDRTEIEGRLPDHIQDLDCGGLLVGYLFQLPLEGPDLLGEASLVLHCASALTARLSGEPITQRIIARGVVPGG